MRILYPVVRLRSSKDSAKNEDSDHGDGEQGAEDEALDGVLRFILHALIITHPRGDARKNLKNFSR